MSYYKVISQLKERTHLLWYLRRNPFFRKIALFFDFPLFSRMHKVRWKVCVRLMRHLSSIFFSGNLEPEVTAFFSVVQRTVQPKVFWDIGANFGYYSWILMSENPELKTVLFEPDKDGTNLLNRTIQKAHLKNAQIVESAVCEKTGDSLFLKDQVTSALGTLQTQERTFYHEWYGTSELTNVKTVSMDHLIEQGFPPPDMIKIDVEGACSRVIEGGKKLIQSKRPLMVFECFPNETDKVLPFLNELGYTDLEGKEIKTPIDPFSNFIAVPPELEKLIPSLREEWEKELEGWRKKVGKA